MNAVAFTGKGKLILFLWYGTVSVAPGPFVHDPSYYIAVIESKDAIQEGTQKPSSQPKRNDDNSFFSPPLLYFEKFQTYRKVSRKSQ